MSLREEREAWIVEYLRQSEYKTVDVTNSDFHAAYHNAFPLYRVIPKMWGAEPVQQAMRDLKSLYDKGTLTRRWQSVGGMRREQGFPAFTWSYYLQDQE